MKSLKEFILKESKNYSEEARTIINSLMGENILHEITVQKAKKQVKTLLENDWMESEEIEKVETKSIDKLFNGAKSKVWCGSSADAVYDFNEFVVENSIDETELIENLDSNEEGNTAARYDFDTFVVILAYDNSGGDSAELYYFEK